MSIAKRFIAVVSLLACALLMGCVTRAPTIAHIHLGHALTGVHVTPGQVGYLSVAEARATAAVESSRAAVNAKTLPQVKQAIADATKASASEEDFGLRLAMVQASSHISFAADSDDASDNVRAGAAQFARSIGGVVERCNLIELLAADIAAAARLDEAKTLTREIEKLAMQNLNGVDVNQDGVIGGQPAEYGFKQLRKDITDMVAREDPPYRTVDQTYLFNLVRLPNGKWVFDKFRRGGNIDGYK